MFLKMAIALLLSGVLVGCGASDDEPAKSAPKEPKTFDVSGNLKLLDDCDHSIGDETGYDDINGGTAIYIRNSTGDQIALGELIGGSPDPEYPDVACTFNFRVPDVPLDGDKYSIEVGDRGDVVFDLADAGRIAITLGY